MLVHCVKQINVYFATHDAMNRIRAGRLPCFLASPARGRRTRMPALAPLPPRHGAHGKALFSCYF